MSDALTVLERISVDLSVLAFAIAASRGKSVPPAKVQPTVSAIARAFFEFVRPELERVQNRQGLVDEIDFVLHGLLRLAVAPRERQAYQDHIDELRPFVLEATIDLMKARGTPRLVLSDTERAILETLGKMLPMATSSYEQALRDVAQGSRVSWRGTASELREVLREVVDHLAPDDEVLASDGFRLEQGRTQPTQKQKVRYVLRARRSGSAALAVAEEALTTVDASIATLVRSTYNRSSASTHARTSSAEIRNLKRYIDALLAELLEIA